MKAFHNLYFLIRKNLKNLIRSKGSALIVILAPLVLILLIGLSYNTSQTTLNVGIYTTSFTPELDQFLTELQEEDYKIVKYDHQEDCIDDIKLGFTHTCLILPENFQIEDNSPKEVTFYIDQSNLNLVHMIISTLDQKFNLKSQQISQELTADLLTKISHTQAKIEQQLPQFTSLKEKNQQTISTSDTLRSDLSSLDLSVTNTTYNTSLLDTFKTNTSSQVGTIIGLLSDAKSDLTSSSLNSSEKDPLLDQINVVDAQLDQLLARLDDTGAGSLTEISAMITSLNTNLNNTKNKLAAASTKVSSAGSELNSLSSTLNEGISSLDNIQSALTEIKTELDSQKVTDPGTISAPLITKIERISVEKSHLNYLFPSLLVLVVMFISILLGTNLVMMEKHSPAYFRNFVLPIKRITFVLSTYLTTLFLVLIQIIIVLSISLFFLKNLLPQIIFTGLILLLSASVFTLLGMAIGYLFKSEDTGTLASISLGALFLFASGVILPLESMPASIRQLTYFNPFVLSEKIIKEIFIFGSSFSLLLNDILIILGYAVVLFTLILVLNSFTEKHYFNRFLYKHHLHHNKKPKKVKPKLFSRK